ncbi:putative bifunctional diguanylate cyclase/phosphodiesterase [Spirillospora albida]|uniref:putative bifunctional diguanylate cyclase/phosphodiesterase n=1 Tax=Spirillospora albida TaxID=58123 RepID=UPI00068EF80D|nr:EAL domain-containing protein [Spirillospora albida]
MFPATSDETATTTPDRPPAAHRRRSGHAPLLPLGLLAVAGALWFLWTIDGTGVPAVAWAPAVLSPAIAACGCLRSARDMTGPTRLFWRRIGLLLGMAAVGVFADACDTLLGPGAPRAEIGPLAMAVYVCCLLMVVWALLMIPAGSRSRREWVTLALDAGITVLGGTLFLGYHLGRQGGGLVSATDTRLAALSVISMGGIVAVAAVKIALTGTGPLDRRALGWLGAAAFLGAAIGSLITPLAETRPHLAGPQLAVPLVALLVALGADRQLRAAADPAPERRRRSYSRLPYIMFGAANLLVIVARATGNPGEPAIAIGVMLMAALIVVRQVVAFREVSSLLLDRSRYERRFRALLRYSSDVTAIVAADGTLTYVSPNVVQVTGRTAEEWVGRNFLEAIHPGDGQIMNDHIGKLLADPGGTYVCQVRMRHADGSWRWTELHATNSIGDPAVDGIVSNVRDITEIRRVQEELAHQAGHDALTQLANRALLVERAEAAVVDSRGRGVALAMIDLDDFKAINDRLGHTVGDALLVAIAGRLRNCVRPGDTVARLGGDEFAVLLRDIGSDEIDGVLDRISTALSGIVNALGHDLLVHASIGLVEASDGTDATELLRRADVAMYMVKEGGKRGHLRYTADMDARADERARLGADLQHGFARGELFLAYQPVVTLPDGGLYGVETLIRWRHPERGLVSPVEFVPVAERNGTIVQIGAWVLREACRQMVRWQEAHGAAAPRHLAVNVSARQLREPSFAQTVADALAETGLDPAELLMEITETAVFDGGLAVETVRAVQALGVKIALDDFGTGHSSLGLLRTCPVDVLKVDKLFVDEVTGTVGQAAIATSIAQIAQALDLHTVAEGVETAAQAHRLYQMGYRLAQGYHFAKPLPPEEIDALILRQCEPRIA